MEYPSSLREKIELRAYQFWENRGRPWGTPEADWFQAEQELSDGTLAKMAREVGSIVGTAASFLAGLTQKTS